MSAAAKPRSLEAYSDDSGPRIRAYLASMRPMRGVADIYSLETYQRGRSLIEAMALTATGEDMPAIRLSAADCADILAFVSYSEPVEPGSWWKDPKGSPSHLVGYYLIVQAVQAALRRRRVRS